MFFMEKPAEHSVDQSSFTKKVEQAIYFHKVSPKTKGIKIHREHKSWALITPKSFSINLDRFYYKGAARFWHKLIVSFHISFAPDY